MLLVAPVGDAVKLLGVPAPGSHLPPKLKIWWQDDQSLNLFSKTQEALERLSEIAERHFEVGLILISRQMGAHARITCYKKVIK